MSIGYCCICYISFSCLLLSFIVIIYCYCLHISDSRVYSWGRNNYGQLGHSKGQSLVPVPRQVNELEAVPLNRITAGGAHNFAISITGNAYGWGRNR